MSSKIEPRVLKGFRDFLPQQAYQRQYALEIIRKVFELWGFTPLETPALEYLETFHGNIGEDEHLFFKFTDQGEREVALRYDQTVPTCRVIAQYPDKISLPFKRYQIQTVWRCEKPQKGRFREFLQCDADVFGLSNFEADAEMIALTIAIFKKLGFVKPKVLINDRALYKNIPYKAIVAIDKLKKIGVEGVRLELIAKGYASEEVERFLTEVTNNQPNDNLKTIFRYLDEYGLKENYVFEPTLARSFSYSSGTIWEVVVDEFSNGSLAGGERFDSLVARFSNREVPAVGFAIGFDRTLEAMESLALFPNLQTKTKVLVTVFGKKYLSDSQKITSILRSEEINTDLYLNPDDDLSKQIKYADRKNIPFVVIVGEEEKKSEKMTLKNLQTKEQQLLTQSEVMALLKNA